MSLLLLELQYACRVSIHPRRFFPLKDVADLLLNVAVSSLVLVMCELVKGEAIKHSSAARKWIYNNNDDNNNNHSSNNIDRKTTLSRSTTLNLTL